MGLIDSTNFYSNDTLSDTVAENVKGLLKEGLLEIGAFINVSRGQIYKGNDLSRLYPHVDRPGVTDYTIYGGGKDDWIWESGIALASSGVSQPYVPSGIFVNGNFFPTGTDVSGTAYYLDFARGRVVFDSPLSSSDAVQVPRGLRFVSVYDAEGYEYRDLLPNWIELQANSSGFIDSYNSKAFLPAIFVSVENFDTIRGTQLGTRGKVVNANIRLDIISNTPSDRKKLIDLAYALENKPIQLYDTKIAPKPLDERGRLVRQDAKYQYLGANFPLTQQVGRFDDNAKITKFNQRKIPMFAAKVDISLEMDIYPT